MAIRRGSSTPSAIYRGATAVQKVMRGTVEVWSASPYPQSGSWGPIDTATLVTVASHTIVVAGTFTVAMNSAPNVALQVTVNGGAVGSAAGTYSFTAYLPAGAVIGFRALAPGTYSGSWSIVKN